jgi:hypothetical protein
LAYFDRARRRPGREEQEKDLDDLNWEILSRPASKPCIKSEPSRIGAQLWAHVEANCF